MEKKTECEIVQDLLLNYADDILNQESKKLVEKHLIECEKCRQKLSEIKSEINQTGENQKVQIDYLKKVRRKNKIKSVLLAVVILFVIFASWYFYKLCIIQNVCRKVEKQFSGENFYMETISSHSADSITICKTWYKDGKYKIEMWIENEEEILQKFDTRYGNLTENAKLEYFVKEDEKKVRKEKLLSEKSKNEFACEQSVFALKTVPEYWVRKLGEPFYVKISTDHKEIGRKYYVFESGETKKWVDMETGLPIMSFGEVTSTTYYKNTKIPKERFESIVEHHYEFGKVTDEEVEMPDLAEYEWEEFDWEEEMEKSLKEYEKN